MSPARPARTVRRLLLAASVAAGVAGCGGDGGGGAASVTALPPLSLAEGCNPLLAGGDCFLPYPSDFYRIVEADTGTATGARVVTDGAAKLRTASGASADVSDWWPIRGYSRHSTIVGTLLAPTAEDGTVGFFDSPTLSLDPRTSATLILDTTNGTLVPHFADVDPRAKDPSRTAIVLHPVVPLAENRRYLVAYHGLVGPDGNAVRAPEGFRRLRDREYAGDPALEALAGLYEDDLFAKLDAIGVARAELQLAWDFTTGADYDVTVDMRHVRALTLEWLASNSPEVAIDAVEEHAPGDGSGIWRTVSGTITGPRFVDSPDPGARLARDDAGSVRLNGTVRFPFLAEIPESLRDSAAGAGRVMGLGHGFFGTRNEVRSESALQSANKLRAVVLSTDWWGMATADAPSVFLGLLANPSHVTVFTDRVHQAMANWLTLTAAVRGPLAGTAAFQRPESGASVYDPRRMDFWGLSNGAILGTVQSAMNPWHERVLLNVGGAGWTQLMWRSGNFVPFLVAAAVPFPDPMVQQEFVASLQRHFDRIDPAVYAPLIFDPTLEGNPSDRRVVLQFGLGDAGVPNVGSFYLARALGARLTEPSVLDLWGVEPMGADGAGAGVTAFDMGVDTAFEAKAIPPVKGNIVHDGVRLLDGADRQLDALFTDAGSIIHPCDGPCDPN